MQIIKNNCGGKGGFTLLELMAVIAILALVAMLVVPRLAGFETKARQTVAQNDMLAIREAIVGTDDKPGYLTDMANIPGFSPANLRIANLLIATNLYGVGDVCVTGDTRAEHAVSQEEFLSWNSESNRGWRGPYLRLGASVSVFPESNEVDWKGRSFSDKNFFPDVRSVNVPRDLQTRSVSVYGFPGEPSIVDPWGNPYVIQVPPPQAFAKNGVALNDVSPQERFRFARIVSAGPNGIIETPCWSPRAGEFGVGTSWNDNAKRRSRLAGLESANDAHLRGDDIVLFLNRADVFE